MSELIEGFPDTALGRLFTGAHPPADVTWFSLPGGRTLYAAGDPAETLYFVRAGRLGAVRREEGHEQQFLGVIKSGEPAGEMALIAGTPHTATVMALRDSEIMALPRAAFFAAARRHPEIMAELARLMIVRARHSGGRNPAGNPTVFGFVGVSDGLEVRAFVEQVEREVAAIGRTAAVVGSEALQAPTEWFTVVEQRHDFVLYVAEPGEAAWTELCGRQVDRLFLVGKGDAPPPGKPSDFAAEAIRTHRLMDLILVHDRPGRPTGSAAWLDAAPAARLFHVRSGDRADAARIARVITATSVGLVLSGGGARAYAHIGAIRALREAGTPIDFVGGASMGAIIAAGVALGWDDAEIDRRIRKGFVESSPLADIALPIIAMTRGLNVAERLRQNFDDVEIADLWLPYFCVSSNLTTGAYELHKRGPLRNALRASIALPGILPPVIEGDNVLVDGAVMRNFPADVMRIWHSGPIVGVDVSVSRGLTAKDMKLPGSLWSWLLSGDWRKGPPIVSLLMRAATVSTQRDLIAAHEVTDLLIAPKLEGVEIRDWKAYEPAVEAGYKATVAALEKLDRPVTELRHPDGEHGELGHGLTLAVAAPG